MSTRRETIPFHVSSTAATKKAGERYEVRLDPPLDIGHTAHPTVYLNNLSFTNTFANVDKDLYDNADVRLQVLQGSSLTVTPATITLDKGLYTLPELEAAIMDKLYNGNSGVTFADHKAAVIQLQGSACDFNDKYASGTVAGHATNLQVKGAGILADVKLQPVLDTDSATGVASKNALTIAECQQFFTTTSITGSALPAAGKVLPPLDKAYVQGDALSDEVLFGFKAVTLEADTRRNRVRIQLGVGVFMESDDLKLSPLFRQLLGVTDVGSVVAGTADDTPVFQLFDIDKQSAARIDKTRAVAFHCPSLGSGTYGTGGKHGDSQLAVVPITVGIGEVQSWETFEPIRIPAHVAGGPISVLTFYISNEEGELIDTMGERFEAVMVVEYDVPLK